MNIWGLLWLGAWCLEYSRTMGEIGGKYLASVAKLRKVE